MLNEFISTCLIVAIITLSPVLKIEPDPGFANSPILCEDLQYDVHVSNHIIRFRRGGHVVSFQIPPRIPDQDPSLHLSNDVAQFEFWWGAPFGQLGPLHIQAHYYSQVSRP